MINLRIIRFKCNYFRWKSFMLWHQFGVISKRYFCQFYLAMFFFGGLRSMLISIVLLKMLWKRDKWQLNLENLGLFKYKYVNVWTLHHALMIEMRKNRKKRKQLKQFKTEEKKFIRIQESNEALDLRFAWAKQT